MVDTDNSTCFDIELTATSEDCRCVWTNFGIAMSFLPNLESIEQIRLQQINQFWYNIAVSRAQTRIEAHEYVAQFQIYQPDEEILKIVRLE